MTGGGRREAAAAAGGFWWRTGGDRGGKAAEDARGRGPHAQGRVRRRRRCPHVDRPGARGRCCVTGKGRSGAGPGPYSAAPPDGGERRCPGRAACCSAKGQGRRSMAHCFPPLFAKEGDGRGCPCRSLSGPAGRSLPASAPLPFPKQRCKCDTCALRCAPCAAFLCRVAPEGPEVLAALSLKGLCVPGRTWHTTFARVP